MKMNKKKILSLALVAVLIAILSFSSLAWFSDADEVTNKFMVASSDDSDSPESIFSVNVWEPNDDPDKDGDGKVDTEFDKDGDGVVDPEFDADGDGKLDTPYEDQNGMEFDNVLPGAVYSKEPHIENTGAYDQYVRVKVTVGDATAWENALGKYGITDLGKIFLGHNEADWIRLDEPVKKDGEWTYVYYLQKVLKPGEDAVLFTDVKIPEEFTQEDMANFNGEFKIKVIAEAMQADGLPEDVTNALGAFQLLEKSGQEIDIIKK